MNRRARSLLSVFGIVSATTIGVVGTAGCAEFFAGVQTANTVISIAQTVLTQISAWIDTYFRAHPDAVLQKKIDDALQRTLAALRTLEDAARIAKDVNDAKVQADLGVFQGLYNDLISLVSPIGVVESSSAPKAEPGDHLVVPPAKSFTFKAKP